MSQVKLPAACQQHIRLLATLGGILFAILDDTVACLSPMQSVGEVTHCMYVCDAPTSCRGTTPVLSFGWRTGATTVLWLPGHLLNMAHTYTHT